ncbi:hypothetical protein OAQ99_02040 [Candidatus Kapabacteria bacterium]|nr:hypothetical protein [Candidatus Kapabacteria bacterium]
MKFTILLLLLTFFSTSYSSTRNKTGITASTVSGTGVVFSHRFNKDWFLELNAFAFYNQEENKQKAELHLMSGFELQRNIWFVGKNRLYGLIGFSNWHIERTEDIIKTINDIETVNTKYDINRIFNIGLGIGWEYNLYNKLYISLSTGLQYQNSDPFQIGILIDRNPNGTTYFGPSFGLSLKFAL